MVTKKLLAVSNLLVGKVAMAKVVLVVAVVMLVNVVIPIKAAMCVAAHGLSLGNLADIIPAANITPPPSKLE